MNIIKRNIFNNFKFFTNSKSALIDQYIQNQLFTSINIEINNGYVLSEKQTKNYSDELFLYLNSGSLKEYNIIKKQNFFLPNSTLVHFLYVNKTHMESDFLKKEIKEKSNDLNFQIEVINFIKKQNSIITKECKKIKKYSFNYADEVAQSLFKFGEFILNIYPYAEEKFTQNIFLNTILLLNFGIEELREQNSGYNNGKDFLYLKILKLEELNKNIKNFTDHLIAEKMTTNFVLFNKNNIKINNTNHHLLEHLEKQIQFCRKNIDFLPLQEQTLLNNIVDKHFPELMNRYLSFSNEEIKIIKDHDNKNAEELLENSLKDITSILQKNIDIINANKMQQLSVKSLHINGIKQSF